MYESQGHKVKVKVTEVISVFSRFIYVFANSYIFYRRMMMFILIMYVGLVKVKVMFESEGHKVRVKVTEAVSVLLSLSDILLH